MSPLPFINLFRRDDDDDEGGDDEHDGSGSGSGLSTGAIAGIAVGAAVLIIGLVVVYFLRRRTLRKRKLEKNHSEPESKSTPFNRALLASGESDDHQSTQKSQPSEIGAIDHAGHKTPEPMSPAPAYSSVQNIDSSYNAHTGKRESELDGTTKEINELGTSDTNSDIDSSAPPTHASELPEKTGYNAPSSEAVIAHELPVSNSVKKASKASSSGSETRIGEKEDHARLGSSVSELPGGSVGTNITGGTVSSIGATR